MADLYFSEYIEGSSNNKALEIYNSTGSAIDLAVENYVVQYYFNGSTTAGLTINLTGTVANDDVFVLAQSSANSTILAQADQTNGAGWFNGDDAIVLRKGGVNGTIIDSIGQIGIDPGTEWGTGLTSTADNTLRRKTSVTMGDTNPNDAFDPSTEWDGFPTDTFDNLGTYGGLPPSTLSLSVSPTSFSEAAGNNAATATVTRTGSTTDALTVTLTSSDTTEATVPTSVVIAAGQASATFAVTAVDDAIIDGSQNVSLTATATEFGSSTTNVTVTDNDAPAVRIRDIQGTAHTSPLNGQLVSNVAGVVTAVRSNGFYLQDSNPDNNDATSEGIFVFTSSAPTIAVGNSVLVSGRVSEFRPGDSDDGNLTISQISSPTITTVSTGNALPAPIILGNGGRAIPTQVISNDAANGNVENSGTVFDPAQDGIDFYESLEGMRVQVNNAVAVGPTNNFGEIPVLADNGANASVRTSRGGIVIQPGDFNPERIIIDDVIITNEPQVNVGDTFNGATVGVIDYSFGNFKLLNTQALPSVTSGGLQREVTHLTPTTNQLTVGTFNVENLDPGDGDTKFNSLAGAIVNNLKSPDIISLEEIQDNNGPTNDSVVDASQTYQKLISAIASTGGPTYEFRQINPVDDTNGGEPGGNIRVGFLFNPNRVSFVDRPGGSSTSNTTVSNANGFPLLSDSPGLIDPTNDAFDNSRKPLVGEFIFNGQTVYVVGNHFNSKGGDQPLFGANQPPTLTSEVQRNQQATIVRDFVQSILASDPNANVVVAGDLNDFQFSNPVNTIESAGLTNLIETLPLNEQYTYVFDGNSQVLDHILVSSNLLHNLDGFDVVHINSEFADQTSDHDPSVARFHLSPSIINGTSRKDTLVGTFKGDTITGFLNKDTITTGTGSDLIVYTKFGDRGDTITDFTVGADKLVFTELLDKVGYHGTNAIADGFLGFEQKGANAVVLFDPSGSGKHHQRAFITLENVSAVALNDVNNFVF